MITYEAFASGSTPTSDLTANPASALKSMCESTRLDAIELILINLSNYKTCHDCSVRLLRRPGEQDYPRYPNTYLFDAFRARMPLNALFSMRFSLCQMCLGTYGQRQTVWGCQQGNRTVFPSLTRSYCRSAERKGVRESRGRQWASGTCSDVIISTCESLRGANTHFSQRWCC